MAYLPSINKNKMKLNFKKTTSSVLMSMLLSFSILTALNSCVATAGVTYQNYTPPSWAPPYDDVSSIQYYYFPDYDMYYDVWNNQFWYSNNGAWQSCVGLPPMYSNVDLNTSYMVLVNKKYHTPWNDNDYYARNYPAHSYDSYKDIVVNNRIVKNTEPNHELVPRAFNENNNRVTFMQHPINNNPQANEGNHDIPNQQFNNPRQNEPNHNVPQQPVNNPVKTQQGNEPARTMPQQPMNTQQGNEPSRTMPQQPVRPVQQSETKTTTTATSTTQYHHVTHEVPIQSIKPYMPAASQKLAYGSGFKKH